MAGVNEFNSDLDVQGTIKILTVPNSMGTVLTYNPITKEISTRTNSEFIGDLGLSNFYTAGNHINITSNTISMSPTANVWVTSTDGKDRLYFGTTQATDTIFKLGQIGGVFSIKDSAGGNLFSVNSAGGTVRIDSLSGTGNRVTYTDLSGALFRTDIDPANIITPNNIGNYIPAAQNLSTNTTVAGRIDISGGGTSATLTTLLPTARPDSNIRALRHDFSPYFTVAGSASNYPLNAALAGIRIERYSNATNQLGFDITTRGLDDELWYKTFSLATNEFGWYRFASREWSNATFATVSSLGNYVSKTGDTMSGTLNFVTNTLINFNGVNKLTGNSVDTYVMGASTVWDSGGVYLRPQGSSSTLGQWIVRGMGNLEMPQTIGYIGRKMNTSRTFNKVYQAYTGTTSQTGILSIKFPQVNTTATMFDVTIKLYSYQTNSLAELRVSFYRQASNVINATSGLSGYITTTSTFPTRTINVGIDSTGLIAINLGETTTSWLGYLSFEVERVETKFSGYDADWGSGWSYAFETDISSYIQLRPVPVQIVGGSFLGNGQQLTINGSATLDFDNPILGNYDGYAPSASTNQAEAGNGGFYKNRYFTSGSITYLDQEWNVYNANRFYKRNGRLGTNTPWVEVIHTGNLTGSNGINVTGTVISPIYGTTANTVAQGNDSRFHNPVTLGTANGLSLSTQVLSLALATPTTPGAMSNTDKTKLDGIATGANNYVLPVMTATTLGGGMLFSNIVQTVASNPVSSVSNRTYGIQFNSSGQLVANIPWVDTTYNTGTLSDLNSGTISTGLLWSPLVLNQWLSAKLVDKVDKTTTISINGNTQDLSGNVNFTIPTYAPSVENIVVTSPMGINPVATKTRVNILNMISSGSLTISAGQNDADELTIITCGTGGDFTINMDTLDNCNNKNGTFPINMGSIYRFWWSENEGVWLLV